MTSKEIEVCSGMTRANIRFYETAGLLSPARTSNGYRDYSDADLEILKRIRLLRTLHISLEEIKSLHTEEHALIDALNVHLATLQSEEADLQHSQEICERMRKDEVCYQTLDAQHYLDAIETLTQKPVLALLSDRLPKVRSPWRRCLARHLDFGIYAILWSSFFGVLLNINPYVGSAGEVFLEFMLYTLVQFLLMFAIEPFLLSKFGTTPGKWILGLYVVGNDGERLSYAEARSRLWSVFRYGMGFGLPIYDIIQYCCSYTTCASGETLAWEQGSTMTLRDEKGWRVLAYIGAYILIWAVIWVTSFTAQLPKHQGDITVAEFSENYNYFSNFHEIHTNSELDETGAWVAKSSRQDGLVFPVHENPEYLFTEVDGIMTGMEFVVTLSPNSEAMPSSYRDEMLLSLLAFVQAKQGFQPFADSVFVSVFSELLQSEFEDFEFSMYGVQVSCDVEHSGYIGAASGVLFAEEGADTSFRFHFKMMQE